MGFLKRLPSFSKRNRNKIAERLPVLTSLDPLKEDVKTDLPLNVTPLDAAANMNTTSTDSNATPSNAGLGLFDDIFTELNQTSPSRDSLQENISLSFALSQQLQLDSTLNQHQHQMEKPLSSSSSSSTTPAGLFGQDSIYSRYVTQPQQQLNDTQPPPSNAGVASSTLPPSDTNTFSSNDEEEKKEQETTTQMVLDSDISGSDDDDDEEEEGGSEDEMWGAQQQQQHERKLEGACPIMEQRPNDHRWNVNRHGDQHSHTVVESNQTMLNRMKNRHRQQVKLQNSRPPTPGMMRSASPMHCTTPPPPAASSAMILPPHLQRNPPITSLTRSSSASSAYRQHSKPWISDYSPSRPSPLASNRSLRSQPSATSATSLRSMKKDDEDELNSTTTGEYSEDADDEADHDENDDENATRPTPINNKKYIPTVHHSSSVPDLNQKKRQGAYSPSSSHNLVSDQHSTVSLSSSSSSSTSTTTSTSASHHTPSPTPLQRHLFQRHDGFSMQQRMMRTMTSEPNLKQLASMPQQQQYHAPPMNGYHPLYFNQQQQQQIQQQRQRLQLEWEMMQLYQREQQLKQEYMMLQQRSFFSPIHKSSTLPSLSTVYQDPRFYYASSSSSSPSLGPGLH